VVAATKINELTISLNTMETLDVLNELPPSRRGFTAPDIGAEQGQNMMGFGRISGVGHDVASCGQPDGRSREIRRQSVLMPRRISDRRYRYA
jgi:hypothetical protein